MEIEPIKTEADYRATLKEIESLMTAEPGTPEGERLDVLATLVEAWERKHFPLDLPDPVEAIKFAMDQRGLTVKDLERLTFTMGNETFPVLFAWWSSSRSLSPGSRGFTGGERSVPDRPGVARSGNASEKTVARRFPVCARSAARGMEKGRWVKGTRGWGKFFET